MRTRFVCCVAAALLVASVSARADTFNISGTFTDNSTMSGTIDINTTTGVITSVDVTYLSETFDVLDSQDSDSRGFYDFAVSTSSGEFPALNLLIAGTSLVGFGGGPLCSLDAECDSSASVYQADVKEFLELQTGAVTASVATTPEPSSLMLLGTGLVGFAGVLKRRLS